MERGELNLAHQIHIADVDAQLEGGRRNEHLQLAALEALLGRGGASSPCCRGAP